ncbi:hypothetical protein LZ30DRAFT_411920 [Colletotrichum cereale]|nr:hypothetical protein LZ30DRAFT_411920 [Colletotrichum cereale]
MVAAGTSRRGWEGLDYHAATHADDASLCARDKRPMSGMAPWIESINPPPESTFTLCPVRGDRLSRANGPEVRGPVDQRSMVLRTRSGRPYRPGQSCGTVGETARARAIKRGCSLAAYWKGLVPNAALDDMGSRGSVMAEARERGRGRGIGRQQGMKKKKKKKKKKRNLHVYVSASHEDCATLAAGSQESGSTIGT